MQPNSFPVTGGKSNDLARVPQRQTDITQCHVTTGLKLKEQDEKLGDSSDNALVPENFDFAGESSAAVATSDAGKNLVGKFLCVQMSKRLHAYASRHATKP